MKPVDGKVKVAVVGLGHRGQGQLKMLLKLNEILEVVSICDLYADRTAEGNALVKDAYGKTVPAYTDYKEQIGKGGMDAVMVFTSWQTHTRIATYAMKAGYYAAMEVCGACSLQELWHLVQTYEDTGVPCMLLENACYSELALSLIRMVKVEGLFGELLYATAGYEHDIRDEIGLGREIRHYRHDHFVHRNADLYPTHHLGPWAFLMDINRGNRFLTLTSTATKARGLAEFYKNSRKAFNPGVIRELEKNYKGPLPETVKDYDMIGKQINCGDIISTTIKCSGGEVINLVHDNTLPRPHMKNRRLQGTKGILMDDRNGIWFDGISPTEGYTGQQPEIWEPTGRYVEKYGHPLWAATAARRDLGGHGGTDSLVIQAFIDAVKRGAEVPIDVYDAAAWMAVTALSEDSIALGSHPVAFPDFTNGRWVNRKPLPPSRFTLDVIHWDLFK